MFGKSAEIAVMVWLLCLIAVHILEQTDQFEMECNILTTLEALQTRIEQQEARLRDQESTIELHESRLSSQESTLAQQESRLSSQESTSAQQESRLSSQESTLAQQESRLSSQESTLAQQESRLSSQESTIEQQEARLRDQESTLQLQDNRLHDQEMEIASLKQRIGTNEEPIALRDCGEIFANGTTTNGVYIISPDGRCPFSVHCDMADDGWTVIQRRIDGAVNFRRTWDEYVQGFGEVDGEHWLGLEKIHRLTKDGYEIYFDIETYDGTRDHAHYKVFTVHGSSSLYTMNVDAFGYEGTLNELLSFHNGQKFTTFDRDNDVHSTANCAEFYDGGGWWYNNCYKLGNPNGVFGKKDIGGVSYSDGGIVYVRTITIKVRQSESQCATDPLI